jgi:hypothetical protein
MWIEDKRKAAGRTVKRYPTLEAAYARMKEENASFPTIRPATSPRPRRQPQRGRHLELEVRQLPQRLV